MGKSRRWSDEELTEFRNEFDKHVEEERKVQERLIIAIEDLRKETRGLLDAWETANKGVTIIAGIGRLVKWVAGVAAAVGILWYIFKNGTPPPP